MELEIFKEKLNQSLGIIEHLTRKSINLPILNNVLIETEKNFLKLSATNLETSIIWWILSKVKIEGKIAVPASFLKSVVGFIKEDKIKLKSDNKNLVLEIKDQLTQIQGVNLDDFPIIPKIVTEDFVEVDGEKFNQGIDQIVNIPSISQIRPEISGIYFSFQKDKIKIVGTDSFRLAEKTIDLPKKIKKDFSFILPQFSTRELMNILSLKPIKVKIYYTPNQVLFEWQGQETSYPEVHFSARLIEGEYPNYQEIIPKKYTVKINLNREDFQNQVKKAGLFSGKISEVKLTMLPKENKLKIFSQSIEVGKSEAYLPVKMEGKISKEIETSFNYRFLIDGLNNIKSSEIIFSLSDDDGPATITPVGDDSYIYILMPIKTS